MAFSLSSIWSKIKTYIAIGGIVVAVGGATYGYYEHSQAKEIGLAYKAQVAKDNTAVLSAQNKSLSDALAAATHQAAVGAQITATTTLRNQQLSQTAATLQHKLAELKVNDKTYAAWRARCLPASVIGLYDEPADKVCAGGVTAKTSPAQHPQH